MRQKVPQILLRRFRKWKMATSLMEWMMILVRSSSGSSNIKHTAAAIKERMEEIARRRGLEFESRRGLQLAATTDEVVKED
jgi:hypothetical protein